MDQPNTYPVASSLCAACGMCCNGILFFGALLQPGDDSRALAAMGLKIKRQGGALHLLQPCTAHENNTCLVYEQRPERCRVFECRQLKALSAGDITEDEAFEKIREARELADHVRALFEAAGDTRHHKAFVTRYAAVFVEPLDPSPEAVEIRTRLQLAMKALEDLLERDFRIE